MNDFIMKFIAFIPQYLLDFGAVFSGPKRFVASRNVQPAANLQPALIFGIVSLAIFVLLTLPLLPPNSDLWVLLVDIAIVGLVLVTLAAGAIHLAWFIVGGRAGFGGFFITFMYYFGVIFVVEGLFNLLGFGVFRGLAPDLYAAMRTAMVKGTAWPDLSGNAAWRINRLIRGAGIVFAEIWGFCGWGAFRVLNGVSKRRSAVALAIWVVMAPVLTVVAYFLGLAFRQS